MEVMGNNVTLLNDRKRNPQSRPIVGDVARLEGGRVVARHPIVFSDGTSAYAIRDYNLGVDPPTLSGGATPKDWSEWMRRQRERRPGNYRELGPREFLPKDELEFADFRGRYPHTAAFMGLPEPQPRSPLFPVGPVHFPFEHFNIEWRRFLGRHDSGDFGIYGDYKAAKLSDEELWTLAEQSVLSQNAAAIAAKSGPIRSRFRDSGRVVALVTVLSPRGPRTLITVESADAGLAGHP